MEKIELYNDYCSDPPNTYCPILPHPSGNNDLSLDVAIFNEHRFAFYYWIKWLKKDKIKTIPDLITFDWHLDLVPPDENERLELAKLDLENLTEVSIFSWARLNPNNDNHILSATYLNQINNIWVIAKDNSQLYLDKLIDINKNIHQIKVYKNHFDLFVDLKKCDIKEIFFDIDLDFFTIQNCSSNDKEYFTYMKKKDINSIFNNQSDFCKWVFTRIRGLTIALEPVYTGGIYKSIKYLNLLQNEFFNKSKDYESCIWKHR